jgi:glycosyltransferase involved in cell wall biosynthesis
MIPISGKTQLPKDVVLPVSVIIPCWKCEDTIIRAMESVVNQTRQPAEVIIVNDASGCATATALNQIGDRFAKRFNGTIKIIESPAQTGPAGARNNGWQRASYPLLAFLDADDAWHFQKIEIQYAYMNANPGVTITGHRTIWLKPGDDPPVLSHPWQLKPIRSREQLVCNRFHTRSVMVRRDIPFRFEAGKRYSEDYLLWLELLLNGFKGIHMELPLAYTFKPQYGAMGLSANLWAMESGELDTYLRLYRKALISFLPLAGLICLSLLKFVKRLLLSKLVYGDSRRSLS